MHPLRYGLPLLTTAAVALLAPSGAAASAYHSPGYQGTRKAPKTGTTTVPDTPLPPVTVGDGNDPSVLVDAAGTAHIAWMTGDGDQADGLHYCQLKRGASTCTAPTVLRPEHAYHAGDGPDVNVEEGGPKLFAVGDQLVMMSHRIATYFPHPDSSPTNETTLIYTSEDGGATWTGPAVVGNGQIGGTGVVFGTDDNPLIGTIGGSGTFQAISPGAFTSASATLGNSGSTGDVGAPDAESLALDGGQPVAAFDGDGGSGTAIRRFLGGDPNSAANWGPPIVVPFAAPELVGGPSGLFLLNGGGGRISVRKITGASVSAPQYASGTNTSISESFARFFQDEGGTLHAAWVDNFGLTLNSAPGGSGWAAKPPTIYKTEDALNETDLSAAGDGGGVAVVHQTGGTATEGPIVAVPFGTQAATGKLGLGNQPGTGGDPGDQTATASCQKLTFGKVVARTTVGCFEHGLGSKKAVEVADGTITLNGLTITPDGGGSGARAVGVAAGASASASRIVIDPKHHTIDTTGPVTVTANGDGLPDVPLWHGELHVKLPGAGSGATLFDFPASAFPTSIDGFPITVGTPVKLTGSGVKIPVTVKLPPELGSVQGKATLQVTDGGGLQLDSLDITATDVGLGPITVHDFAVHYDKASQTWLGNVSGDVYDFGFAVALQFTHGKFTHAHLSVSEYPGELVYAPYDVYLDEVDFDLKLDPTVITGGANFGAVPYSKPNFLVGARGQVTLGFAPFRIAIEGDGYILGTGVTQATFAYSSAGSASLDASAHLGDENDVGIFGSVHLGIAHKDFNGSMLAKVCAFGGCVNALTLTANNKGVAYCFPSVLGVTPGSITHDWDSLLPFKLHPLTCVSDDYGGGPLGSRAVHARAGGVASGSVAVPAGATVYDIEVDGVSDPAKLVLRGPDGAPIALGAATSSGPAVATAGGGSVYIGLKAPAAGAYTVEGPGVTAVTGARGYAMPTVKSASVGGRGTQRTLSYSLEGVDGVQVDFVDRDATGDHEIGIAKGGSGRIPFTPAPGPGGHRDVIARAIAGGRAVEIRKVASYVAPGPAKPGAARKIRVRRSGAALKVTFTPGAAAQSTVVEVALPHGVKLRRVLSGRARSVKIAGVGRSTAAAVRVTTVTMTGLQKTARAVRAPKR